MALSWGYHNMLALTFHSNVINHKSNYFIMSEHSLRRSQSVLVFGNEEQALQLSGGHEAVQRALMRSTSLLASGRCREWEKWKARNEKLQAEAKTSGDKLKGK